jgi:hypothetical protein
VSSKPSLHETTKALKAPSRSVIGVFSHQHVRSKQPVQCLAVKLVHNLAGTRMLTRKSRP